MSATEVAVRLCPVRLNRYIKEANVDLDFDPFAGVEIPYEEQDLEPWELTPRQRQRRKEVVLKELVTLLEPSGRITNPRKCLIDLRNRENKATTALGLGIAVPHVRTPQAKDFVLGVAIAREPGLWFDAVDEQPVRIFFPMVAPSYNDKFYRKIEKAIAQALLREQEDFEEVGFKASLLAAETPGEVIRLLCDVLDG